MSTTQQQPHSTGKEHLRSVVPASGISHADLTPRTTTTPQEEENGRPVTSEISRIETQKTEFVSAYFSEKGEKSLFGKIKSDSLLFIPKISYNKSQRTEAAFSMFSQTSATRRNLVVWQSFAAESLHQVVPLVMRTSQEITAGKFALLELPQDREAIQVTLGKTLQGKDGPVIAIAMRKDMLVAQDSIGNQHEIALGKSVAIRVAEGVIERKTEVQDGKKQLLSEEKKAAVDRACCTLTTVVIEGKKYLLVEGLENIQVHLPTSLVERSVKYQERLVSREVDYKDAALMTIASPEHPFENQDCAFYDPRTRTAIIADGMGGYSGGVEASRLAVYAAKQEIASLPENVKAQAVREKFVAAIDAAHVALKRGAVEGDTTIAMARIVKEGNDQYLVWANVGDSRVSLHIPGTPQGKIRRISIDDSLLRRFVRSGSNGRVKLYSNQDTNINPVWLREQGFDVDTDNKGDYWVTLDNANIELIQDLLDNTNSFDHVSDQSFLGMLYHNRNISDGVKDGDGTTGHPVEIHSGIQKLYKGDSVLIMSDGLHDTAKTGFIRKKMDAFHRPMEQVHALVKGVFNAFKVSKNGTQTAEGIEQRAKPDDVSLIIMAVK